MVQRALAIAGFAGIAFSLLPAAPAMAATSAVPRFRMQRPGTRPQRPMMRRRHDSSVGCSVDYTTAGDFFVGISDPAADDYAGQSDSAVLAGNNNESCDLTTAIGAGTYNIIGGSGSGSYSFLGAGQYNIIEGASAFIGAGADNGVAGDLAAIGGGFDNYAAGPASFVGAGDAEFAAIQNGTEMNFGNMATGTDAFVGAGDLNEASGNGSFIGAGGYSQAAANSSASPNTVSGTDAFLGAGDQNMVSGNNAFLGSGDTNAARGSDSAIAGGQSNTESGEGDFNGAGSGNNDSGAYAFIGAGESNTVTSSSGSGVVAGTDNTVSGTNSLDGAGQQNSVSGIDAFIGGGAKNLVASNAMYGTVLGGNYNDVSAEYASILGGFGNAASGSYAIVAGGDGDTAAGIVSFAAGYHAAAAHNGSFVWSDYSSGSKAVKDTAANQFVVRASGGTYVYSNEGATSGVKLAAGSGTWASLSDRNAKTDIVRLDDDSVLAKVAALPVSTWRYKSEAGVRHVGPMAQDFYSAFGVGEDNRHITSIDEDGVALAAIKALSRENQRLELRLEALEHRGQRR